jgi:hypothetical protein
MATTNDTIRQRIGNGGYAAPIGWLHKRAILHDCGPAAFAVYSAIADRANWKTAIDGQLNRAFLLCRGFNVKAIVGQTGLSRSTVKDALDRLQERGWIARSGHTSPTWTLNADKLRAACASAPKAQPFVTPADPRDVAAILAHLQPTTPEGKKVDIARERQTAAYLLQTHTVDELRAAIDGAGVPVWSLSYIAHGFKMAAKQGTPAADEWADDGPDDWADDDNPF